MFEVTIEIKRSEEEKVAFNALANQFIPGYSILSEEEQFAFESTNPGREFVGIVEHHLKLEYPKAQWSLWRYVFSFFEQDKQILEPNIEQQEQLSILKDTNEYQTIIEQIKTHKLELARKKANERALQLAKKHPFLNDALATMERKPFDQFVSQFIAENQQIESQLAKVEETFLTNLLFSHLQKITASRFNHFIDLKQFNQQQANHLAKIILQDLNNTETLPMDPWLTTYKTELLQFIQRHLLSINGKEWQTIKNGMIGVAQEVLSTSLSFLYQTQPYEVLKKYLDKTADAHMLFQATGLQSESPLAAMFDFYNYGRVADQISTSKQILTRLFRPFLPLYEEYRDIAFYEKNFYRKMFRTVMPILVIAAFVVLSGLGLGTIPELAFIIAAIPILFIGIALATKYVTFKNTLYQWMRETWSGGPYEVDEFQVNPRMRETFEEESAQQIRKLYTHRLERLDKKALSSEKGYKLGTLDDKELESRKKNLEESCQLRMEWFDIHDNHKLGTNLVIKIVSERVRQMGEKKFQRLQKALLADIPQISTGVQQAVNDLKTSFSCTDSSLYKEPTSAKISDENALTEKGKGKPSFEMVTPTMNYSPRLFPRCLKYKHKLEQWAEATQSIGFQP